MNVEALKPLIVEVASASLAAAPMLASIYKTLMDEGHVDPRKLCRHLRRLEEDATDEQGHHGKLGSSYGTAVTVVRGGLFGHNDCELTALNVRTRLQWQLRGRAPTPNRPKQRLRSGR